MTEQYEIELPNDKAATYKVVTFIIALINVAAFIYLYANETNVSNAGFALTGIIMSVTALVFLLVKQYSKNLQTFRAEIAFLALAFIWYVCGNTWLGLLMMVFGLFGIYSNKKPVTVFNSDGISYPAFPPKKFSWNEIDFVILKDGVLTIETIANQVFQFTLSAAETAKLDEAAFNGFCDRYTKAATPSGK